MTWCLTALVASIDGATQAGYEAYRRRGSLALALEKLAALAKKTSTSRTPQLTWKFIVHRSSEHELEQARRMARRLGVAFVPVTMGLGQDLLDWTPQGSLDKRVERWVPTS